jgi:hypothetical protein
VTTATLFPGYAVPAGSYHAAPVRRTTHRRLLLLWLIPVAVVAVVLGVLSQRMTPPSARYVCPPDCGRPPTGVPVSINPRFAAPDGSFTVSYPAAGTAYRVTTQNNGVTAEFTGGDGGTMRLFSEPAQGRTADRITRDLVAAHVRDARVAYEIPNAMVGYERGYGEAVDFWPQGSTGDYTKMRVLVMVAVKNDLALVASAVGPFREFGPDFGAGKPSGANMQLALDMGKYVNSFTWRGDPPR